MDEIQTNTAKQLNFGNSNEKKIIRTTHTKNKFPNQIIAIMSGNCGSFSFFIRSFFPNSQFKKSIV